MYRKKPSTPYLYGLYGKRHDAGEFNLDSFAVHFPGLRMEVRRWKMSELSHYSQAWKRFRHKLRRFPARLGLNGNSSAAD